MRHPRRLLTAALASAALLTAPLLATAGPAEDIEQAASRVPAEVKECIERAGDSSSAVRSCERAANEKLAALERAARKLEADEQARALAAIQKNKAKVRKVVARAPTKPAEEKKETADLDATLSGAEAETAQAPSSTQQRRKKRKRTRRQRPRLRSAKGSTNSYGAAVSAPPRSKSRPGPRPRPRPRPEPVSNTENYTDHGVNKMTETSEDKLSTFAIDVDTGSYVIARRKINEGKLPPKASVRVEEFVNYFRYDYPQPTKGPFSVALEGAPSPFYAKSKGRHLMRVGVQGKKLSAGKRKPVHLTFLVDVSGSMNRPDKLGLAKKALTILTNNLKEGDTVALVTYAGATKVVLEPTGMYERGRILNALDELRAGGGTAMGTGMELAYKQALTSFKRDHVNRVIVLSDGDTNIGPRSKEAMFAEIEKYVSEGVTLSMIGLGMGNYKDSMMEQLANKGDGNYYYIDSIQEARKVFGEQMDGTLQVIAKDVKIQVEFNPKAVKRYRLIGYENRDIADKDFRDDAVDAGEIGAGHTVTALYEVELVGSKPRGKLATVRVRHKKPDGYKASEDSFVFSAEDVHEDLAKASDDFQFAAAVAGFAEVLRESPYAKELNLALLEEVARGATDARQLDRVAFLELIKKARALKK